MKKFAVSLLTISMVLLLVFALNGGFDEDAGGYNNISGFNEAAFALPVSQSGASDGTAFLVGEFDGSDGSHLSFDGHGNVKLTTAGGIVNGGTCTLLQQHDLSAMIRFQFDDGVVLYSFTLNNEKGDYTLADQAGNAVIYCPVII